MKHLALIILALFLASYRSTAQTPKAGTVNGKANQTVLKGKLLKQATLNTMKVKVKQQC